MFRQAHLLVKRSLKPSSNLSTVQLTQDSQDWEKKQIQVQQRFGNKLKSGNCTESIFDVVVLGCITQFSLKLSITTHFLFPCPIHHYARKTFFQMKHQINSTITKVLLLGEFILSTERSRRPLIKKVMIRQHYYPIYIFVFFTSLR